MTLRPALSAVLLGWCALALVPSKAHAAGHRAPQPVPSDDTPPIVASLPDDVGQTASAPAGTGDPAPSNFHEMGKASFYGPHWDGRRTASGAVFDMHALTAAHHWLPFGTRVRVRVAETGQEVVVIITDRLRAARRVIDLSLGAAQALGMVRQGVAMVTLSPE
ncbi:septal ring lytic transglycosylase RlpA family protein [Acidisphaera rubrifaciens]|uniref:Endolytic peptidoglycan transglycosylase RlpA n=1 Tax=Acidisphaera rubrifaciens HS-AP3 TaxID=1231350 RepID=A0A0D6P6X7_9PROT|nr:septal ring lytic transglycosylase RlpA family protein [Acidisphaera rubrifaciens]GAN77525.1 rare lipoprotein A [Acidisphaera rubrifaciens HS-AP3]